MFCMFAAFGAIFIQHQFFRRIEFIAVGEVVLAFTDLTHHRSQNALFFFCHIRIISCRIDFAKG